MASGGNKQPSKPDHEVHVEKIRAWAKLLIRALRPSPTPAEALELLEALRPAIESLERDYDEIILSLERLVGVTDDDRQSDK